MVHEVLVVFEQRIAGQHDGGIGALAAQVDLGGSKVARGRTGETHNHGVVALVNTLERDGQVFFHLEWHVMLAVGCRFAIFVGIDAEHGKVGVLAWPYPVVAIATKLSDVIGRIGHKAHVLIGLFVEYVELVATEVGHNACIHALLLAKVALFEHLGSERFKKTIALHGIFVGLFLFSFGVHLFSHIGNAHHEGECQAFGCAQFLSAVVRKVAVLHVVVANAAHLVHVAETAVVVGEHKTVGTYHLAGAATAKYADALAQ